eukprot:TRINITY_DN6135_c0_g2_i1.p1 TRINITY_DN6135_c0_g2~~TRINITY_DN6135_c0_g2_i1.p1  ORF type:complete len:618 (-),score=117.52 TRINITY_DN6135_c0_g2_i1:341-2194(-)
MRVERSVQLAENVHDELLGSLDGLAGYASETLCGIRFELTIFLGLVLLWTMGFKSRIRMGRPSNFGKKGGKVDEGKQQNSCEVAASPRSPRFGSQSLDGSSGSYNRGSANVEASTAENYANISARLMQLCTVPDKQAKIAVRQLKLTMRTASMDFAQVVCTVVKTCTAKRNFQDSLAIYDLVSDELASVTVDRSLWSCLLFCAIESRCFHRCGTFFERLRVTGGACAKDYWNMIRCGSMFGNWQMMLELIHEMRTRNLEVDNVIYNTALATCVASDQIQMARKLLDDMHRVDSIADVITYNTLMKGYAKNGNMDECFHLFDLMRTRGLAPSQITYGVLLDGCISNNRADRALEVFDIMTSEGCPLNTVLYTTLIKGFAREGKVDQAMRVFEQMNDDGNVSPDLITFSIVLKANCDAGRLDAALDLLGVLLRSGLSPDEVIFNNLLAGCAKQGNTKLAKRIYTDMVAFGVKPSSATFSILIRLFSQCNLLDEAAEMLLVDPSKHNVEIEARLFTQLIHCCIRARQGRKAVEVYEMLCKKTTPNEAVNSSMLSMCVKLNMLETAGELLETIASNGGSITHRDALQVVEGARRKNKGAIVDLCMAAVNSMNAREVRQSHP